ncbi:MAG: hypothetical protein JWP87_5467 [Labilithrix sp.]|nr:hypothetical protein [Labilithrix sp.]
MGGPSKSTPMTAITSSSEIPMDPIYVTVA